MSAVLSSLVPEERDSEMARDALRAMQEALRAGRDLGPHDPVRLTVSDSSAEVVVPKAVMEFLSRVLANVANGQGVTLVPAHAELTTQQAADLLNVSRPFLVTLLESGKIDYRVVGTHRRVKAESLMTYMRKDDATRSAAADELTAMTRELGLT